MTTHATVKIAVLYARYSTDLQNDRSIDDQFAECRAFAERDGLRVVDEKSDAAKSSATLRDRDALAGLMLRAEQGGFQALVVESLDRLSRDQADLAQLYKHFHFHGVEIRAISDGVVTPMHVGMRGMLGSMFLDNLARTVRRRKKGDARDGHMPGGRTYGYRPTGKKNEREIDPAEAEVVRRIFREYADGRSPRAIALGLTQDRIPPPSAGTRYKKQPRAIAAWSFHAIAGGGLRKGIIRNPLYVGRLIYGLSRNTRNPQTGRMVKRATAESEHIVTQVPDLAIVDRALFDRANAVHAARAPIKVGKDVVHRPIIPRQEYLLSGLLRCGACNGLMRVQQTNRDGSPRFACGPAFGNGSCQHRRGYDHKRLQAGLFEHLSAALTDPEAIVEAAKAFHRETATLNRANRMSRADLQKRLERVQGQLTRLIDAIQLSDEPVAELAERLKPLQHERAQLTEKLRVAKAESNVVDLHPKAIEAFKAEVEQLCQPLAENTLDAKARAAFRNLVDVVLVHPTEPRAPYEFTTYGRLDTALGGGGQLFPSSGGRIACVDSVAPAKAGDPVFTGRRWARRPRVAGYACIYWMPRFRGA